MAIYAIRWERETSEKVANRFKKQVRNFRLVIKKRATRYNVKKPTKALQRQSALKREEYRKKRKTAQLYA